MRWDDVVQLVEDLPDVVVGASYGTPALKVKAKLLTRWRTEDNSLVLLDVAPDERDMLIEANPATFHTTPHYDGYPIVLARLEMLEPARPACSSNGAGAMWPRSGASLNGTWCGRV